MAIQEERDLNTKLTNEAKPGDQWLRFHPHSSDGGTYTVLTVAKTTKTRITFDNKETIMKATCALIGGAFSRTYFYPATEARMLQKAESERADTAKYNSRKALNAITEKINRSSDTQTREDFVALVNKFLADHS